MWVDPEEAIEMLQGTSAKYESIKDWFGKIKWQ
jgi:hypothetical protein